MGRFSVLFDLGNSRLKWAFYEEGRLWGVEATPWQPQPQETLQIAFESLTRRLKEDHRTPESLAFFCTTFPERKEAFRSEVQRHFKSLPLLEARSTPEALGLINGYQKPERLGVDRFLQLIAAKERTQGLPCMMLSAGTAWTMDFLGPRGAHLGGYLLPSPISAKAQLMQRTPLQLEDPILESLTPFSPGRSTQEAFGRSVMLGALQFVKSQHEAFKEALQNSGPSCYPEGILLCGGEMKVFLSWLECAPWCVLPVVEAEFLSLEGLGLWSMHQTS